MAEYITKKQVIEWFSCYGHDDKQIRFDDLSFDIQHMIPEDVAPVVHGQWDVKVGMNFFRERICPVCKKRIESNFWSYCPNCGAKMDL